MTHGSTSVELFLEQGRSAGPQEGIGPPLKICAPCPAVSTWSQSDTRNTPATMDPRQGCGEEHLGERELRKAVTLRLRWFCKVPFSPSAVGRSVGPAQTFRMCGSAGRVSAPGHSGVARGQPLTDSPGGQPGRTLVLQNA